MTLPDGSHVSPQAAQQIRAERGDFGPTLSIEFSGGDLRSFAAALRSATKEPVNIALQGDADAIKVEPMRLQNVSVDSALRAALGSRANEMERRPDGSASFTKFEMVRGGQNDAPVFVVTRSPLSSRSKPDQIVDVISIQRLVSGDQAISADIVLAAIDAGLGLQDRGNGPRPEIKYHKDSALLLVYGAPEDVGLINEIVKRMTTDHDRQRVESAQLKAFAIDRAAETKRAQVKLRLAESEVKAASDRASQAEQSVQKGVMPVSDAADARLALQRAQAAYDMIQIDLDRLQQLQNAGVAPPPSAGDGEAPDPRDQKIRSLESRISELEAELGSAKDGTRKSPR